MPLYPIQPVDIQLNGTDQGQVNTINFSGATTSVSGNVATITITGGGNKEETHIVLIAVATEINF